MVEKVQVCESLLALAGAKDGSDAVVDCLQALGRICGASLVGAVLCDDKGAVLYSQCWTASPSDTEFAQFGQLTTSTAILDHCRLAGTQVLPLGSGTAFPGLLTLATQGQPLPTAVLAQAEAIKSILYLTLDRARLQADSATTAQRLSDLGELGNDWLWEMDTKGRFTYVSRDLSLFGLATGTFLGQTLDEIGHRAGADIVAPDWKATKNRLMTQRPFRNFFHPVPMPDGSRVWLRSSGKPCYDPAGTFIGFKGVSSELTELVEGERSAREVAERLTAILDALPDLVFEITTEGKYTDFIARRRDGPWHRSAQPT